MTFLEAKAELKEIARGEYHSVRYEVTEYASGGEEVDCYVYIHDYGSEQGGTWREALDKMRKKCGLEPRVSTDPGEAPAEELHRPWKHAGEEAV